MAEYIGARISLVSKSDIRYLGTLHEINSENSTVALENVKSMGTEGRRNGVNEIEPSDKPWEYIVFRGSDVKDLRIETAPEETAPPPRHVPDDPAILGSTRPPQSGTPNQPPQQQPPFNQPPPYGQFPPYPPIHNQGFGRGGFPPGPGGPGFPGGAGFPGQYGPPPGWYPPGQGFPPGPGQFSPQHQQGPHGPPGAPGQQSQQAKPQQGGKASQQAPIGPGASKDVKVEEEKKAEPAAAKAPEPVKPTATPTGPKKAPTPPIQSKPDVAAATAPPATTSAPAPTIPTGPKGRVAPVIPRPAPTPSKAPAAAQPTVAQTAATTPQTYQNATQAATAAVAAAMAKLPMAGKAQPSQNTGTGDSSVDNLTRKVQEMRTDNNIRHSAQPGTGGYVAGHRGGRGGHRGGRRDHPATKPVEVPTTDYDFAGANAKFNKQDLVKEAIATGSPLATPDAADTEPPTNGAAHNGESQEKTAEEVVIPPAQQAYDKKSSFFDNISSELKDRDDSKRGMEFRSEERKKNMETFGQGSVDNYRGGYRGRGRGRGGIRGRGRGYAGSGFPARGRGGPAGGEGN